MGRGAGNRQRGAGEPELTTCTFPTPADLRILSDYRWEVLTPIDYACNGVDVTVPAGFVTDLASVPRPLWSLFPPHGEYAKAAILHDYLYQLKIGTRASADKAFLSAMESLGVPAWKRWPLYAAVRVFGGAAWGVTSR